jgi:hypothetical protein
MVRSGLSLVVRLPSLEVQSHDKRKNDRTTYVSAIARQA